MGERESSESHVILAVEFRLTSEKRQPNLPVAIVSVLAVILPLLSSHYTYHATGYPIVKALLTPQWMRRLNSYIGGAHNELILVALKLLNAISGFAGGREKKTLLEVFQWEIKVCYIFASPFPSS